jgi:hypothetical protein
MDRRSYEDGRTGQASGPNTDLGAYRQGQLHDQAGTYKPGFEGGGESQASSEPLIPTPKVEVDGSAFTLLITSPLLFTVFPVWGASLWVAGGGVYWLMSQASSQSATAIVPAVVAWLAAFFFGIRLEGVASQFFIYRMFRTVSRWVTAFLFVIWMGTANGSSETYQQEINRATPETLVGGILAAIAAHFVFKLADRIYFPVARQMKKMEKLAASGESLKRGFPKRVVYSLMWIVPVLLVSNLTIRLGVGLIMDDADRVAFYAHYSPVVILAGLAIWLILSVVGILPGTGRVAMTNERLKQVV